MVGGANLGAFICIRSFSLASELRGRTFPKGLRWVGGRIGPTIVCGLGTSKFSELLFLSVVHMLTRISDFLGLLYISTVY